MKHAHIASRALLFVLLGSTVAGAQAQRGQGRGRGEEPAKPVPAAEQHQRVADQQKRAVDYKKHLDQQVVTVHAQTEALQQQKRTAQYAAQRAYETQLRAQQGRVQTDRDFSRDPYVTTPRSYRYVVNGTARTTNQYGADVLRLAVNNGYQQGHNAGVADRQDHWKSNYQGSIGYRDANFGYEGNYIDRTDYNYYFRQGFRRGYQDGYTTHTQYGSVSNGTLGIMAGVLTGILALSVIH